MMYSESVIVLAKMTWGSTSGVNGLPVHKPAALYHVHEHVGVKQGKHVLVQLNILPCAPFSLAQLMVTGDHGVTIVAAVKLVETE